MILILYININHSRFLRLLLWWNEIQELSSEIYRNNTVRLLSETTMRDLNSKRGLDQDPVCEQRAIVAAVPYRAATQTIQRNVSIIHE